MRGNVPAFDLVTPESLKEALTLVENEGYTPFAGGTDLMVLFEAGVLSPKKLVNINGLAEFKKIEWEEDVVTIGALVTYRQIQDEEDLKKEFPLLREAARVTGAWAIQNRGTLGGNIVNASPAADTPPSLLVYEAEVELVSSKGSRWVPYSEFHTGYKKTKMEAGEILSRVRLSRQFQEYTHYYRKVGTRKAQAISKVCMAAVARTNNGTLEDLKLSLGAVAPTIIRCGHVEEVCRQAQLGADLVDRAVKALDKDIAPIDDVRATARYRKKVSQNLVASFLNSFEVDVS